MKLIINYTDNSRFINVGNIEVLCEHIKLQCKYNPDAIKNIRIVLESKDTFDANEFEQAKIFLT